MRLKNIALEWRYTPANYFEFPYKGKIRNYIFTIDEGHIVVPIGIKDPSSELTYDILNSVLKIFKIRMIQKHLNYKIEHFAIQRHYIDGTVKREIHVKIEEDAIKITSYAPGIIITDSNGLVVSDTREERKREEIKLFEQGLQNHTNEQLLSKLFESYESAIKNSKTELVHLYEIRDALSTHFGGERNAQKMLGVSSSNWKKLGILANSEPLYEGRHRGEQKILRSATDEELSEARKIACSMIEAVINYIQ